MKNFIIIFAALTIWLSGCKHSIKESHDLNAEPEIWPKYKDVTIPAEIAPLNFNLTGVPYNYLVLKIKGSKSGKLSYEGKYIDMDIDEWHNLTEQNKGGKLEFYLSFVKNGIKYNYKPFVMHVSEYELGEYGLTYRRIEPGYVSFRQMGIYCRNLSNFEENSIYKSSSVLGTCVNCHTSNMTNPDDFLFHIRGDKYGATVLNHNNKLNFYNTQTAKTLGLAVYPYWHKSGKFVAFSTNNTKQVFHSANVKRIEVFDLNSDLQIFNTETNEFILSKEIKNDTILETFPAFSSDGKTLFFCETPKLPEPFFIEDMKYYLMKADFDDKTGKITSKKDTLIKIDGKSISFPRPSYDGKYLMFTACDYGTFPIWHKEADLYLYNFQDSTCRAIDEINSDDTESFHNWSKNSHWVVFASRRIDGLYTRLYIAQIDDNGKFSKPFLLPQRNPLKYYNELFDSYNTPDFTEKPVKVSEITLRKQIESCERTSVQATE